ncbi:NUDIX domain-containing protein [Cytobacillus suaedae]|nr:NUDIX domain-containing protein [Cytobacillus suaedae]
MTFNRVIEEPEIKNSSNTINREAVRAIIMTKDTILLVQSNRGDYKFPGGGVEKNESHCEALIREVREETGYMNCIVKDKAGVVIERKADEFVDNALFQMTSHYYYCELANEEKMSQQLDDYEFLLNFTPKWVSLDDAISENENLIEKVEKNSWLKRELFVLKEVRNKVAIK